MNNDLHSYNLSKYPLFLCYQCTFYKLKRSQQRPLIKLRGMGSNHRPSGYEPDELPLLYLAIWGANVGFGTLRAKTNFIYLYPS